MTLPSSSTARPAGTGAIGSLLLDEIGDVFSRCRQAAAGGGDGERRRPSPFINHQGFARSQWTDNWRTGRFPAFRRATTSGDRLGRLRPLVGSCNGFGQSP